MHSVKSDLPYPSLEGVTEDRMTANILAPAYASNASELGAILQYIFHHYFFEEEFPEIATLLEGIAVTEMHHLDILGNLLLKLGVAPVYSANPPERCRFFTASCVSYSTDYQKMLLDDIRGECTAIREYREIVCKLKNQQVQAVIERIILDEELHVERLKQALETFISCLEERKAADGKNCDC